MAKAHRPSIPFTDNKLTPQDLEGLDRTAQYLASTKLYGMRAKGGGFQPYGRFEAAAIIACGRRFGWDPFASMEQIALIRNKTCVWGKGVRAAVLGSGLCVSWEEGWDDLKPDGTCTDKTCAWVKVAREMAGGKVCTFEGRFSVQDAKTAGLWAPKWDGKLTDSPWNNYPANQLLWRATGFAVNRGFADVMMGVSVAEEVLDTPTEGEAATSELQRRLDAASAPGLGTGEKAGGS